MPFPSALTKISILLIYLNHVKETNPVLLQVNIKLEDKNNSLQSIESEVAGLSVEDRINALENQLKETAKKYDEVGRGLAMVVADLERASESGELGENALKSVEAFGEKANQREEEYKNQIKTLTNRLKEAEARAEFAERSVKKLQKEVDRLEDELVNEKEKD